jgi:dTDP-4-amino-4,6-dideoxygalactose transaminase
MINIPFNKPAIVGKELYYISQAIHQGHAAGDGRFTNLCSDFLKDALDVKGVFLTSSCTDALEMAALLLDIKPGDEVIVPSFTFVSTANAFVLRGATPVFVDIRPDTLNMNEALVDRLVTPRTKAIVPVHYAGVGCEMEELCDLACRQGIAIVEDNAHGLFATYRGQYLGTFGTFATQSFHETKNFICGEGGALIVNDERYLQRAEVVREKGTNRCRFFRREVDKYTWVDIGSSYLPSDILAAFLYAQLEARDAIQTRRRLIWQRYYEQLEPWALTHDVRLPVVPPHCTQSYHLFYILLPSEIARDCLLQHLREHGIMSVIHYVPLHLSPMGRRLAPTADCRVTDDVAKRMLRLPFFYDLAEEEQSRIIETVQTVRMPVAARAKMT